MSIVANIMLWIFPTLLALALVVGIVVFIVVRRREMRRRAEFHRARPRLRASALRRKS